MTARRHPSPRWGVPLALLALVCAGLLWWQPHEAHAAALPAPAPAPHPLISTNLPAYTNDANAYDPSLVNDANYGTLWDSVDTPTSARPIWIALDLATVPVAKRQQVILAWFNDTGEYLPGADNVFYNLPSNYTIDANAAAGGASAPPNTGWATLVTVTGNTRNAREHVLDLSGYTWVRMTVTGTRGSSDNTSAVFNLDLYDADAGDQDDWLFLGDSITAEGMTQANVAGGPWSGGDYAQLVHSADAPYYPLQIDGGMGGWTSDDGAQNIAALLSGFTGDYVSMAFGTNDANEPYLLSASQIQTYYANMLTMIDATENAGKHVVVPYVPWGCNGDLGQNAQALNNYVNARLATDRPSAIRGPDLWTPFSQHRGWISSDCIHPTYQAPSGQLNGYEQYQRIWEQWAATTIYAPQLAPAVSLSPTSLSFGNQNVGTTGAAQTITLTNSGGAPMTITSIALDGTHPTDFGESANCPLSPSMLAVGASCAIRITFSPLATGARAASISVGDNAIGSPQSVSLSGTGVGSTPTVTLKRMAFRLGSQRVGTTSARQTTTLTNSGTVALTISSITLTGRNVADFAETTTCPLKPTTLAPHAACTIGVTFTPAAIGIRSAQINIGDNAGNSPQSILLIGMGITSAPAVTRSPAQVTTGSLGVAPTSTSPAIVPTDTGPRSERVASEMTEPASSPLGLSAEVSGPTQPQLHNRWLLIDPI